MAITSVGYDGTVDEVQWASMVSKVGSSEYGVNGASDFLVAQTSGTRMINVSAGLAWGRGVMDISDAAAVIQLDAVTTGSRYDLIALRRSWGPTNGGPTEIVVIKGTSTKAIPSGRQSNPGVIDDQPLALVRVQAGSASIPEVIDMRVWARNGGCFAVNDLVRSYVNTPGTVITIIDAIWMRTIGANNVAQWVNLADLLSTGWSHNALSAASGWEILYQATKRSLDTVSCFIQFRRTGAAIYVPTDGNLSNQKIATMSATYRPDTLMNSGVMSTATTGRMATANAHYAGSVELTAVSGGGQNIEKGDTFTMQGTWFAR